MKLKGVLALMTGLVTASVAQSGNLSGDGVNDQGSGLYVQERGYLLETISNEFGSMNVFVDGRLVEPSLLNYEFTANSGAKLRFLVDVENGLTTFESPNFLISAKTDGTGRIETSIFQEGSSGPELFEAGDYVKLTPESQALSGTERVLANFESEELVAERLLYEDLREFLRLEDDLQPNDLSKGTVLSCVNNILGVHFGLLYLASCLPRCVGNPSGPSCQTCILTQAINAQQWAQTELSTCADGIIHQIQQ